MLEISCLTSQLRHKDENFPYNTPQSNDMGQLSVYHPI